MAKEFKRTLVTCALPYANGPVHIGHLAGVYVPADIYVRYLKMRGREVLFVCGSDEHGVPITIKALQQGCTPQDIVDKYHGIIKKAFADFGIDFDIYSRTTSKVHEATASEFFRKLYDEGYTRLGCIGCPMGTAEHRKAEFERYPKYKQAYTRAFDKMVKARKWGGVQTDSSQRNRSNEMVYEWRNAQEVIDWWIK